MLKLTNRAGVKLNSPTLTGYLGNKTTPPSGPTVLILDEFTGADGTLLSAHTIAPTNTVGASWTLVNGGHKISSNRAIGESNALLRISHCDSTVADGVISASFQVALTSGGLIFRLLDSDNYYLCGIYSGAPGQFFIFSVTAGVFTSRASAFAAITPGSVYVLTLTLSGDDIDATAVGESNNLSLSYSSSFNNTQPAHGLFKQTDSAGYADNFQVEG